MYSKLETNIMDGYLGFFSNLDKADSYGGVEGPNN